MASLVLLVAFCQSQLASAGTMIGWDVGWNTMATLSGGTVTPKLSDLGNIQYLKIEGANVSFSTADFFDGNLGPISYSWADASGDQGQHFFDGSIKNSWYADQGGTVPPLTAYDWDGSNGQPASGSFEWLVNNYDRGGDGNPTGDPKNSWIRGTDSSFTYDLVTGEFVANLTSDGIWHWYTPDTPDSPMSGWIKNFDWSWDTDGDFSEYYGRYMTGNFRLVGTFEDVNGLPTFTTAELQYEVANVPEPASLAIWSAMGIVGLGWGFRRRRATVNR